MNSQQLAAVLILLGAGCGSGPDLPKTVPAGGSVKINGQPCPAGANVLLVPVAGGRPASGITDSQGKFTLSTFGDKDGAIPGDHYVGVSLAEKTAAPAADDPYNTGVLPGQEKKSAAKALIPERYASPQDSGIQSTIPPEGTDQISIEIN
ncbi:MAG: hypothetical protein ACK5Q5_13320 [Planctomycetaceae bacterium]